MWLIRQANWYLRYLKKGLKLEEALKKAHGRPKTSTSKPQKGEERRSEGNAPKETKLDPYSPQIATMEEDETVNMC